jgi:hypothetical protein
MNTFVMWFSGRLHDDLIKIVLEISYCYEMLPWIFFVIK